MAATAESVALHRAVRLLDAETPPSDVDVEECRVAFKAARGILANALAYPPRRAEDRAAVRTTTVELRGGKSIRLDGTDIENALTLSDALDLNEVACVELLVAAVERGHPPDDCARAAAGIYLRERQRAVESLLRLLRAVSTPELAAPRDPALASFVETFVRDLLRGGDGGGATLVGRLVEILKKPAPGTFPTAAASGATAAPYVVQTPGGATSTPGGSAFGGGGGGGAIVPAQQQLDPFAASAALAHVHDERGRPCDRNEWFAHERRLVAECLFHAALASGGIGGGDGDGDGGGAVSSADALAIVDLFVGVAAPTLALFAADAKVRELDEDAARSGAYGDAPPLPPPPPSDEENERDLPCAYTIFFAMHAALTPSTPGANGARSHAAIVDATGPRLKEAVEAAAKHLPDVGDLGIAGILRRYGDVGGAPGYDDDAMDGYGYGGAMDGYGYGGYGGGASGDLFASRSRRGGGGEEEATRAPATRDDVYAASLVAVVECARFTWGLTALDLGRAGAEDVVADAANAGALVAWRAIAQTGSFQDDVDASRRQNLESTHGTLRRAIETMLKNPVVGEALAAVMPAPTAAQTAREGAAGVGGGDGGDGGGDGDDYYGGGDGGGDFDGDFDGDYGDFARAEEEARLRRLKEEEDARREAPLTSLCALLAECYAQAPDLVTTASDVLPGFLDAVVEWEHGVESLVGVVGLLAAIASAGGSAGASVWSRMESPAQGAAVTWDHFLSALVGYNRRFADAAAGVNGVSGGARALDGLDDDDDDDDALGGDALDGEMPDADVQGLRAYLGLLSALLAGASPAESRRRVAWIESRYGVSLLDQLSRLRACPLAPPTLKAALLDALGALAGSSEAASVELWRALEDGGFDGGDGFGGFGVDGDDRDVDRRDRVGGVHSVGGFGGPSSSPYGGFSGVGAAHGVDPRSGASIHGGGYGAAAAARQVQSYASRGHRAARDSLASRCALQIPGIDAFHDPSAIREAQAQSYPHARAYLKLANQLLERCAGSRVGPAAGAGRASAAAFRFARDDVFAGLKRRAHRDATERWEMARDAIEHFRIQLRVYRDADDVDKVRAHAVVDAFDATIHGAKRHRVHGASSSAGPDVTHPPGFELMVDFLSGGPILKLLLAVLSIGTERLAVERASAHGEALESAVLAALRCLRDALAMDVDVVASLRDGAGHGVSGATSGNNHSGITTGIAGGVIAAPTGDTAHVFHDTIDVAMMRLSADAARAARFDRDRDNRSSRAVDDDRANDLDQVAAVLGYAQYRFNPELPSASLRILSVLSDRVERLVDLLPRRAAAALVEGAASCLELAVLPSAGVSDGAGDADTDREAVAAQNGSLVLDVLLDNLPRPAPNLAHLLLGFDVARETERCRLDPFGEFNCLTVLLELLEACAPSYAARDVGDADAEHEAGARKVAEAAEAAARLVYELVANANTRDAAVALLTNWPPGAPRDRQRLPLLLADALRASPPKSRERRAAAAHHRAWIARISAAVLDATSPPNGSFPAAAIADLPPLAGAIAANALYREGAEEGSGGASRMNGLDGDATTIERPRIAALELLATLPPPPTPPLAAATLAAATQSAESRRLQRDMRVSELLSDRRPIESGGVLTVTSRGDAIVHLETLGAKLAAESRRVLASRGGVLGGGNFGGGFGHGESDSGFSGGPNFGGAVGGSSPGDVGAGGAGALRDAHKEAVQTAVKMARAFNHAVEEQSAHVHVVSAWADLMAIVASRCLPCGGPSTSPEEDPQDALFALSDGVLGHLSSPPSSAAAAAAAKSRGSSGSGENGGGFDALDGSLFEGGGGGPEWWDAREAPLARLARTLLERLRLVSRGGAYGGPPTAEADGVGGGDPAAGVAAATSRVGMDANTRFYGPTLGEIPPLPPSRCKALLRSLLGALLRPPASAVGRSIAPGGGGGIGGGGSANAPDARGNLYAALLAFLQYVRPNRAAQLPASVLAIARSGGGDARNGREASQESLRHLSGGGFLSPAEAANEAAKAQDEIEAGTSALIRRDAGPLVELLARDVVDANADEGLRATALCAIEALVSATSAAAAAVSAAGASTASPSFERALERRAGATPTPTSASASASASAVGRAFADERGGFGFGANAPSTPTGTPHGGAPGRAFGRAAASPFAPASSANAGAGGAASPSPFVGAARPVDSAVGALGQSLARSGVVRHCLAAVERVDLAELILPTERAEAALASVRAALSLLMRLAQLPGGGARALASSGAMHALINCRAIDAYASDAAGDAAAAAAASAVHAAAARRAEREREYGVVAGADGIYSIASYDGDLDAFDLPRDPADVAAAAAAAAASPIAPLPLPRARHHAVLVPVLRLAGTLVNALADSPETRAQGVAFVAAHHRVIDRILADRASSAHLADLAELEAAVTLCARLVTRRVPAGAATGVGADGATTRERAAVVETLTPKLDDLTSRLCEGDGKYDAFVAAASPEGSPSACTSSSVVTRRVAIATRGARAAVGGLSPAAAAAAAARMERSLRAVRAALVSTQLSLAEQGRATFAALPPPNAAASAFCDDRRPTLSLFARLTARCAEETREETEARARLLRGLASDGASAASAAVAVDARGGFSGSAEFAAAAAAAAIEAGASPTDPFASSGSAFRGAPVAAAAAAAAAAVGARERGIRALTHTIEASLELVLSRLWEHHPSGVTFPGQTRGAFGWSGDGGGGGGGGFGLGLGRATPGGGFHARSPGGGSSPGGVEYTLREIQELSAVLTPAIATLTALEEREETGRSVDAGGRLRTLVRRTRDTLLAAAPPEAGAPPSLLFTSGAKDGGVGVGVGVGAGATTTFGGFDARGGGGGARSPLNENSPRAPAPRFGLFHAQ